MALTKVKLNTMVTGNLPDANIPNDITIDTASAAPASGLTGNTLASGVTASSLTSVGTLSSLTTSGNVGVGASASFKFDVQDNSTTWASRILNTNAGGQALLVRTDATNDATALGVYANGAYRLLITETSSTFGNQIKGADGSESAPAYAFSNNTDMGMYRGASNTLRFATGGTERIEIQSSQTKISTPLKISHDTYPQLTIDGTDNSGNIGFTFTGSGARGGMRWNSSNNDVEILREGGGVEISLLDGGGTTFADDLTIGTQQGDKELMTNRARMRHIDGVADANASFSHGDLYVNHISTGTIYMQRNTNFAGNVELTGTSGQHLKFADDGGSSWSGNHAKIQHHNSYMYLQGGSSGIILRTNSGTNALTMDSSGNSTFAGNIDGGFGKSHRLTGNWQVIDVVSEDSNDQSTMSSNNCFNDQTYSHFKIIIPWMGFESQCDLLCSFLYDTGSGLSESAQYYYGHKQTATHSSSGYSGGAYDNVNRMTIFNNTWTDDSGGVHGEVLVYNVTTADMRNFSGTTYTSHDHTGDGDRGSNFRPFATFNLVGYDTSNGYGAQSGSFRQNDDRHASYWKGIRFTCSTGNFSTGSKFIVLGMQL